MKENDELKLVQDYINFLGKMYIIKNDIVNIIRIYEKILEIAPDYSEAYYNLGIAYYNNKQMHEAEGFFRKAIDKGNHPDSYFYLGVIYKEKQETDRAIQCFRERIRLKTGTNDTFAEEARKHLQQLLQKSEIPM